MKDRIRRAPPAAAGTDLLTSQRGTPGAARLAVYAEGYLARMREALAEVYEAVHHVLGERAFTDLSRAFAASCPSRDYNLSLAGRGLPEFLPTFPRTRELPFLPDLARLEWLVASAFHAFEEAPLDPAELAKVPADARERLRLRFQPSVGVIASAWPILDIWQARTRPRDEIDVDLRDRPQRVLVARRGLQTRCELLDERQSRLLRGLLSGSPLGLACAELAASDGDLSDIGNYRSSGGDGSTTIGDVVGDLADSGEEESESDAD